MDAGTTCAHRLRVKSCQLKIIYERDYPLDQSEVVIDSWMKIKTGDRVAYVGAEEPHLATVRWLGRIPDIFQHQMVAGISLVRLRVLMKKEYGSQKT